MKFLTILLSIVGGALLLFALLFKSPTQPFHITDDMVLSPNYEKKAEISQINNSYGSTQYNSKTKDLLKKITDDSLRGFRCSDSFMRTDQGVYVLENVKVNQKYTRRIKNDIFTEHMRDKEPELPQGSKPLTGRVCELENKTILLFYSSGMYDANPADGSISIRKHIAGSTNNVAFIEILPKGGFDFQRTYELTSSKAHMRCDQAFYIKKNDILILCEEEVDLTSNYYVYELSLINGSKKLIEQCSNQFGGEKTLTSCR